MILYDHLSRIRYQDTPDFESSTSEVDLIRIIFQQITECYLDLNDWTQLKEWKKKEADFLSTINGSCVQRYVREYLRRIFLTGVSRVKIIFFPESRDC